MGVDSLPPVSGRRRKGKESMSTAQVAVEILESEVEMIRVIVQNRAFAAGFARGRKSRQKYLENLDSKRRSKLDDPKRFEALFNEKISCYWKELLCAKEAELEGLRARIQSRILDVAAAE